MKYELFKLTLLKSWHIASVNINNNIIWVFNFQMQISYFLLINNINYNNNNDDYVSDFWNNDTFKIGYGHHESILFVLELMKTHNIIKGRVC